MPKNPESGDKPAPPKRPMASFFLYKQDKQETIRTENPEMKISDVTTVNQYIGVHSP